MTRIISLIAAVAANGAIGFRGSIPWDSPEDRAIFARKTAGGVLVCGRTTADTLREIVGRQSGDTRTLVAIRNGKGMEACGGGYMWTVDKFSIEAVANHYPDRNIWICGGSRLYAEAMRHPLVTEMHISFMDCEPEGDVFFPAIHCDGRVWMTGHSRWGVVSETEIKDQNGCHRVYRRI